MVSPWPTPGTPRRAFVARAAERLSTFSVAARDPVTGMLGVAVSSKVLAVGNLCPFVRPRVGAVATQAWVNPFLGPRVLDLLEGGMSAAEAAAAALGEDHYAEYRQLNVVDAAGGASTYTGEHTDPWCGGRSGDGYAIAGNLLVSEATVEAMERAFLEARAANLGERLVAVLEAGQEAGGDARGRQSAAVLVMCRTTCRTSTCASTTIPTRSPSCAASTRSPPWGRRGRSSSTRVSPATPTPPRTRTTIPSDAAAVARHASTFSVRGVP